MRTWRLSPFLGVPISFLPSGMYIRLVMLYVPPLKKTTLLFESAEIILPPGLSVTPPDVGMALMRAWQSLLSPKAER